MSILSTSTNHFLFLPSAQDPELLQPHIRLVELPAAAVLYTTDDTINRVYFPYTGLIFFIIGVANSESVETGVINRNGVIGVGALRDGCTATNEAIIQVKMTGAPVKIGALKRLVAGSEAMRTTRRPPRGNDAGPGCRTSPPTMRCT